MAEITSLQTQLVFDNFRQPFFKVNCQLSDQQQILKTVSFEDYKNLIGITCKEVEEPYLEVPRTPQYFYRGGITGKADTFWVSFFVPKASRQLGYSPTGEFFHLPYPNLFFLIKVKKGVVMDKKVYSVKEDILSENTLLYKYPYGNVSGEGGICMGSCNSKLESFYTSDKFLESFFLGKDAGHYYQAGEWAAPKVPIRELFQMVMEKGHFPDTWLLPSMCGDKQRTVESVIQLATKTK